MHIFRIDAILDPQSLPRVANYFAQRSIVPDAMAMTVLPTHMRIEVTVSALEQSQEDIIAALLGEVVAVTDAALENLSLELAAAG